MAEINIVNERVLRDHPLKVAKIEVARFIEKFGLEANFDVQYAVVFSEVVYIAMDDAGAWKTELAREMKSIGLEVDMNKL